MDCPRCGTRLTRISLNGELQSVYCEQCRYADVESDHTRASERRETWDDALRRFRTMHASETDGVDDGAESAAGTESDADDATKTDTDEDDDEASTAADAASVDSETGTEEAENADDPEAGAPEDADTEAA